MIHVTNFERWSSDSLPSPVQQILRSDVFKNSANLPFKVTKSKIGLSTIATRKFHVGDVIVTDNPMVSHASSQTHFLCNSCHCPVADLRCQLNHLLQSDNQQLPFPIIGKGQGPVYDQSFNSCSLCHAVWCSSCSTCSSYNALREEHDLLLCQKASKENLHWLNFATLSTNSSFCLVGKVVTKSIVALAKAVSDDSTDVSILFDACCWWEQYNHPVWWELLGRDDKRREECKRGHNLLLNALKVSILRMYTSSSSSSSSNCHNILLDFIDQKITLEKYGQIMGMLECNVMEIDFASPLQEYFSALPEIQNIQKREEEEERRNSGKKRKRFLTDQEEEWKSMKMFGSSLKELINCTSNILGTGLYPLLSLSNHSCDPNASIEFLDESNKGYMLALRDIMVGEEITVTYVPNGEDDNVDPERFRFFKPTRTWTYFDSMLEEMPEGELEHYEDLIVMEKGIGEEDNEEEEEMENVINDSGMGVVKKNEEDGEGEGSSWQERHDALLSFGFVCECSRCVEERTKQHELEEASATANRKHN